MIFLLRDFRTNTPLVYATLDILQQLFSVVLEIDKKWGFMSKWGGEGIATFLLLYSTITFTL